ncbi:hypothetical protein CHRY9390_02803 [Chryseobacterium aquaeductus]|uniref:Outer membrane protein beta-barrel domain-containing protein n=1 Tax=Chryseobacterium aquaeductus TaxID=2675056 RepID=A0A9N8QT60_9FLAO|nr:hypothetical protein [Chryseobacterium aquaeductus]CAA7332082.1 hypothetical protein CHRY9390_02803 [Chryseobacterium potabilaquae]CAD7814427.1 hypothetical protein CHRY9390_02803 [Chryseobacterium aquaeductus]
MKTKFISLAAVLLFCYGFAQENSKIDSQMKIYSKKIDSIITSEKSKMNIELNDLDESFKNKKISSEEKQKQKIDIALKYEGIINEKVDNQKSDLEDATKEIVKNSVLGKSDYTSGFAQNNALFSFKDPKNTKKELLKAVDMNIGLGYIDLTKSASSFALGSESSQMKFGRSVSSSIEVRFTRQFGAVTSPVFYRFGFGYRGDTFAPKNSQIVDFSNNEIFLRDFDQGNLKKSRFTNHYIVAPLDFVFVLNPKYTVENGEKILDNTKGNFRVTAGVYGGVRFLTQNQIIYKNADDHRVVNRENIQDMVNNFLFGGKVSVGFGAFNVFVKKDFTPFFGDDVIINNKYGFQIGLELLYVNF